MKKVFMVSELILVVAILIFMVLILVFMPQNKTGNDDNRLSWDEEKAIKAVEELIFVRHTDTGLVFAISTQSRSSRGHGYMTIVPSEKVSEIEYLIIEPEIMDIESVTLNPE